MATADLLAIDLALLPRGAFADAAIALSAALPADQSHGLRLDGDHLPHVTLSQHFIRAADLDTVCGRVGAVADGTRAIAAHVTGPGRGARSVWVMLERSAALLTLHAQLMTVLADIEATPGGAAAFADGDARASDVEWVTQYRDAASFGAFVPHVTLGHAKGLPPVAPFEATLDVLAVCHLGRFCACRRILRQWTLTP